MAAQIETVSTPKQLQEFIQLPYRLHQSHPLWVPPLFKDESRLFDEARHPFWKTASGQLFLCRENGRVTGRIAAIIDEKYNSFSKQKCGIFGFAEFAESQSTVNALFDAAWNWLSAKGMAFMRGPLSPSTNYTCGTLVYGFDAPPALMMPWNPPWYPKLMENWGLFKEEDLLAYTITKKDIAMPDWLKAELKSIKAEDRFTSRRSSKKTMREDVANMLRIYRDSWADNWGFTPLSEEEAELFVKELGSILNPDFFILFFQGKTPVAGMVALPDLTPLLKRLRGKIGLLAPWHFLRARKEMQKGYRIMLFGILPKYRLHGLPMLLFDEMLSLAASHPGLEWVEGSWVLESNAAIDELIEDFGGKISKRYRIYRKDIPPCPR